MNPHFHVAWPEVFPNAACVVTPVDRLMHRAEILHIEGESYRLREAKERAAKKAKERVARRKKPSREKSPAAHIRASQSGFTEMTRLFVTDNS